MNVSMVCPARFLARVGDFGKFAPFPAVDRVDGAASQKTLVMPAIRDIAGHPSCPERAPATPVAPSATRRLQLSEVSQKFLDIFMRRTEIKMMPVMQSS
jgi:hypothetical protein